MRRIVFCVQNLPVPRDPRVWREAHTLAKLGHEVVVVSPGESGLARHDILEGVEILRYRLPAAHGAPGLALETVIGLVWTMLHCVRLRMSGPIHVLHAANLPDTFFLIGMLLRPFGTRLVFDQHDLGPELAEAKWGHRRFLLWVLRLLERISYQCADLVIVPNSSYRKVALARGKVAPERVIVLRNGPDAAGRTAAPADDGAMIIAFAGIMGRQDNLDLILDALASVESRRPGSVRLDMIGDGDDSARLRRRATMLGVNHLVTWPGWLTGDEYRRRLHSAHVAVSPDQDNSFSRLSSMTKVAEYVAGHMPCVVADLPENRNTAGDAALYFKPGDAADLARRLEELVCSRALLEQLSLAARHRAPLLLWENSAIRLEAAYRWLLEHGPRVSGEQLVMPEPALAQTHA